MSAIHMPPEPLDAFPTWQEAADYAKRVLAGTTFHVRIHKALDGLWEVQA